MVSYFDAVCGGVWCSWAAEVVVVECKVAPGHDGITLYT